MVRPVLLPVRNMGITVSVNRPFTCHSDNSDKGVTPVNIIRFECLKQMNRICQGLVELIGGNFFPENIGADKIVPRNC